MFTFVFFKIDEDVAVSIMLCGLTDDYRPLVMSIESKSAELTVDYVANVLFQEIEHKSETETALVARNKKFNKIKKFEKKNLKCNDCGGQHFRNKCPSRKENINKIDVVLYSAWMVKESPKSDDWYFDSGVTAHMTKNEKD